jgi:hypothetical protein
MFKLPAKCSLHDKPEVFRKRAPFGKRLAEPDLQIKKHGERW